MNAYPAVIHPCICQFPGIASVTSSTSESSDTVSTGSPSGQVEHGIVDGGVQEELKSTTPQGANSYITTSGAIDAAIADQDESPSYPETNSWQSSDNFTDNAEAELETLDLAIELLGKAL